MQRKCLWCGEPIHSNRRATAQFCNKTCAAKYRNRRDGKTSPPRTILCEECRQPFETTRKFQRFCTAGCGRQNYSRGYGYRAGVVNPLALSPSTVGAISELKVATDLMAKGYAVFRAMSPACVCDLAVLCNEQLLRVEVTTAFVLESGKRIAPKKDADKYDILAHVISATGEIIYEPDLPARPACATKPAEVCN